MQIRGHIHFGSTGDIRSHMLADLHTSQANVCYNAEGTLKLWGGIVASRLAKCDAHRHAFSDTNSFSKRSSKTIMIVTEQPGQSMRVPSN